MIVASVHQHSCVLPRVACLLGLSLSPRSPWNIGLAAHPRQLRSADTLCLLIWPPPLLCGLGFIQLWAWDPSLSPWRYRRVSGTITGRAVSFSGRLAGPAGCELDKVAIRRLCSHGPSRHHSRLGLAASKTPVDSCQRIELSVRRPQEHDIPGPARLTQPRLHRGQNPHNDTLLVVTRLAKGTMRRRENCTVCCCPRTTTAFPASLRHSLHRTTPATASVRVPPNIPPQRPCQPDPPCLAVPPRWGPRHARRCPHYLVQFPYKLGRRRLPPSSDLACGVPVRDPRLQKTLLPPLHSGTPSVRF